MKVLSIVGARPQFIKAAPVLRALILAGHKPVLVHTGQHYDLEMSRIFFEELGIPQPDVNLGVGSGSQAWQTAHMMIGAEEVLLKQDPDWVLVYGDTNSTLAGALAAAKLRLPLAHVEAGLRSYNREMPEEHNRRLADHCSDLLFCPTRTAVNNLAQEGIVDGVYLVGDTMYDAVLQFGKVAREKSGILRKLGLVPGEYAVATVHRPYNTDVAENLLAILMALPDVGATVVFPVHPRTRNKIAELPDAKGLLASIRNVRMIDPIGYLDMLALEQGAKLILTDSGGLQKEAYFLRVPCVTLRPETEWLETVESGWNVLVGPDRRRILDAVREVESRERRAIDCYGDGNAASGIVGILETSGVRAAQLKR